MRDGAKGMAGQANAFGRRGGARPATGSRQFGGNATIAGGTERRARRMPDLSHFGFEARYTWRMHWLAFAVLVGAFTTTHTMLGYDEEAQNLIPLTPFDYELFWGAAIIMWLVGIAWCVQALKGTTAVKLTNSDVSGFTLYGTKTIRWQDVDRLEYEENEYYGWVLTIHAKNGSPSASWALACIQVMVWFTDKTGEEIIDAIRAHRPDLAVPQRSSQSPVKAAWSWLKRAP